LTWVFFNVRVVTFPDIQWDTIRKSLAFPFLPIGQVVTEMAHRAIYGDFKFFIYSEHNASLLE